MEDFENKLGAILNDPQMMSQIMTMAQQLGGNMPQPPPQAPPPAPSIPGFDIASLAKIAGIANAAGIDQNEQALLCALEPYLSHKRIRKLEKAMRAAKIAGIASTFLGSGILSQSGR